MPDLLEVEGLVGGYGADRITTGAGRAVGHRFPVTENARTCVAGIYVDVTDHLRATVQRQEAEDNLQALRDHGHVPCATWGRNGQREFGRW